MWLHSSFNVIVGNFGDECICVESVENRPGLCGDRREGFSGSVQQSLEIQVSMAIHRLPHSQSSASSERIVSLPPPKAEDLRLEVLKVPGLVSDLSSEDVDLLQSAWRKTSAWKQWGSW
ncbi:hypothetical protein JTB14_012175 [Gonioctena quinquepunctata]|nr:hypothetical protein JTB14_012175 [Gonioctena quinquepunctata]